MNTEKCEALKARCAAMGESPLVDIAEFFDGNDDLGSIGCNLMEHPGMDRFRSVLFDLRKLSGVKEVLAQIAEVDPGEESWPFTDTILIVGDVDLKAVKSLVEPLQPSDIGGVGVFSDGDLKAIAKAKNAKLSVVWWD